MIAADRRPRLSAGNVRRIIESDEEDDEHTLARKRPRKDESDDVFEGQSSTESSSESSRSSDTLSKNSCLSEEDDGTPSLQRSTSHVLDDDEMIDLVETPFDEETPAFNQKLDVSESSAEHQ